MSRRQNPGGASAPLLGSKLTVKIEKLAVGGAGIARHEGLVIFVPLAVPEDALIIELTTVKKNFAEGKIVEVLSPGPARRNPPCPVALVCGGCNWQQMDETEQRRQKELLVLETIKKFNPQLQFEYLPLKPSPRAFRYRNRIQPKYKNNRFGFFARQSHQIVEIQDCPLAEEPLAAKIPEAKEWAARQNVRDTVKLEMYIADDQTIRYGLIDQEDDGVGFSQVNRFQNDDLIATVLNWASGVDYDNIFDLYAGAGNFTFPLAQNFPAAGVLGVELNPKLVSRAQEKAQGTRLRFQKSDVETYMRGATIKDNDLVILDPPRAGTSAKVMQRLVALKPRRIIYISCHPVSLARDLSWFFNAAKDRGINARISRVQAFEMFPQTDHVETIVELRVDS